MSLLRLVINFHLIWHILCSFYTDQIETSPYLYDSHVQLIQLLRQLGDLDKARQARRNMNKIFPLSEGTCTQACTRRPQCSAWVTLLRNVCVILFL